MRKKRRLYYFLLNNIGVYFIFLIFRLILLTTKVKWVDKHYLSQLMAQGKPIIYAFWHQDLVVTARLGQKVSSYKKIFIMTSLSRDGELISRLLRLLGFGVVRGSSSRGAVRGIIQLKKAIETGNCVAVAVDGPRGPRHVVKPGVLLLAKLSGAAIVPFTIQIGRKKCLNSWDRCEVPYPFTGCKVTIFPPKYVPEDASVEKIEEMRQEIEQTLLKGKMA